MFLPPKMVYSFMEKHKKSALLQNGIAHSQYSLCASKFIITGSGKLINHFFCFFYNSPPFSGLLPKPLRERGHSENDGPLRWNESAAVKQAIL